ncbi:MAG TPA: hypothetical protein V6D46_03040 [Coleofasciculaceae cyanobacterium]
MNAAEGLMEQGVEAACRSGWLPRLGNWADGRRAIVKRFNSRLAPDDLY